jgi:hypothetical protein
MERTRSVIVCIGLAGQLDPARLEAHFAGAAPSVIPVSLDDLLQQGAPRR